MIVSAPCDAQNVMWRAAHTVAPSLKFYPQLVKIKYDIMTLLVLDVLVVLGGGINVQGTHVIFSARAAPRSVQELRELAN